MVFKCGCLMLDALEAVQKAEICMKIIFFLRLNFIEKNIYHLFKNVAADLTVKL